MLCHKAIKGTIASNRIVCLSTTYANARNGTGTLSSSTTGRAGQYKSGSNYYCYEAYAEFDTSSLPDDAVIKACHLAAYPYATYTADGHYDIDARLYDWGGGTPEVWLFEQPPYAKTVATRGGGTLRGGIAFNSSTRARQRVAAADAANIAKWATLKRPTT